MNEDEDYDDEYPNSGCSKLGNSSTEDNVIGFLIGLLIFVIIIACIIF